MRKTLLFVSLMVSLFAGALQADELSSLPPTRGRWPVGRVTLQVEREAVLLWYPADTTSCIGRYATRETAEKLSAVEGYYEQSPEQIRSWSEVGTSTCEGAPAKAQRFPLIILLPGAGVYALNYTAFAQEFASQGFVVATVDYFSPGAPKRGYNEDDFAATESDMAHAAIETIEYLAHDERWSAHVDMRKVYTMGHSIGGAAAIASARRGGRIRGVVDMDGAPFGESLKGTVAPLLVLQSHPIYSDADLAKRGRTREYYEKLGEQARKQWADIRTNSGGVYVEILSIAGTGHFSFSDAPFVMPTTITRFGGKIIDPLRGYTVITGCVREFLDETATRKPHPKLRLCKSFPEVSPSQ
ncbi:MAG TPA: alpha/beta fold hydrolase [candidate division Zixibacteria bacterium]|nr:alpha/beta fold hydrolase [candidate division Zixibacteria bacterium]